MPAIDRSLSDCRLDDAVSSVVSGGAWGADSQGRTGESLSGDRPSDDDRSGSPARRVAYKEEEPVGPIIGDAFSRARHAAVRQRRQRGPPGWEDEVAEVMNSGSPNLPQGLAAELLYALEFASLPLDGWLDGEDDETDWNNAQAVLHDLPCTTGGLVAVRLLRNLCRSRVTFCEQLLDEGEDLWHVLLPFLCWCSFQHPRAETVGTAPAKDDGRLWVTQLLESLALVAAEVVGSLTWVYFWIVEVLERATGAADLRLTAAAVGLLRNLSLDHSNCRRLFMQPEGQPFIAQMLPAALAIMSPLGLLRFGDTARHLGRAQTPHKPSNFDANDHEAGKVAAAAADATDRLAKVAQRVAEDLDRRRCRLRDDFEYQWKQQQQQEEDKDKEKDKAKDATKDTNKDSKKDDATKQDTQNHRAATPKQRPLRSEEEWHAVEVADGEIQKLRVDLRAAQAEYAKGQRGDLGTEVTLAMTERDVDGAGRVTAKVLYNYQSAPGTGTNDDFVMLPVGTGVEGGGLPVGGQATMVAWQGGVTVE